MEEKIISARIDKKLYEFMKMHDDINWSAVVRRALVEKVRKTEQEKVFDEKKAREAAKVMDEIAKSKIFNKGKSSTEIIREWRDKKKLWMLQ